MPASEEIFEKMMEKDYCSQRLGLRLLSIESGHCKIEMTVTRDMLNGHGMLHGGMAYSLADSTFAFAANSYGRVAVSLQGSMNFLKPAKEGDRLIAEASPLSVSHKTAQYQVEIKHADSGEKYYYFCGTVYRSSKEF